MKGEENQLGNDHLFEMYDYLGADYPAFRIGREQTVFSKRVVDCYADGKPNEIDAVAILEYLVWGWILADRTMVKDVRRTPWLSRPYKDGWQRGNIQYDLICPEQDIVEEFVKLTLNELRTFLRGKQTVGILLSGGMDSRVCAALLGRLIEMGEFSGQQVVGVTWGKEGCRDVEYARRICQVYGWESVILPINAEVLYENIQHAVNCGGLVSPVHMHNMGGARELPLDGIIAATYGDSIGRGQYSGKHVSAVRDHLDYKVYNKCNFIYNDIYTLIADVAKNDVKDYFHRQHGWANSLELDYQAFYLRNKLQVCLNYVGEKIPLHQLFTSPSVYSFVLSLNYSQRSDSLYKDLLTSVNPELLEIPWSKTGMLYGVNTGKPDDYTKEFHEYHEWIRKDLRDEIRQLVLSDEICRLGIFDMAALETIFNIYPRFSGNHLVSYDEVFIWFASLALLSQQFDIVSNSDLPIVNGGSSNHGFSLGAFGSFSAQEGMKKIRKVLK